jgi:hypothetical protein
MNQLNQLFQALNTENTPPFPFTPESVNISPPQTIAGEGYNTVVTVSARPDSGYYGSVPVYYSRIDLAALGNGVGLESDIPFTKESFLAALNQARQSWISESDLETVSLPLQQNGVVLQVALKANHESYGWAGTNTITILIGMPKELNTLHQLLHSTMPGTGYW